MNESKKSFSAYGIFVWFLAILFYLYEFFLRVLPATVSKGIIHDLDITLGQFALISSAYYITYSSMQIPVGILIDRFGARLLGSIACIVCTVGVIGFAYSDNFYNAIISRLLIGFGSSFGFVTLLVVALNWFPREHFGFLSGLGQALGALGPLMAGGPIILILNNLDGNLRSLFLDIAIFGSILSLLILIFVRNQPPHTEGEIVMIAKERNLKQELKSLIKIPQVWVAMIFTGSVYVSLPMLGAYWGTLYLDARGFPKETAGFMISMIWVGLALGCPIFGRLSDHMKKRKPILGLLSLLGFVSTAALLFFPTKSEWVLIFFFLCIGIAGAAQALAFALITEHVPSEVKATAVGMNNTANMLFASIIPPIATILIQAEVGVREIYKESDFIDGFLFMPGAFLFAFLICAFFMKETFARPQQGIHHVE